MQDEVIEFSFAPNGPFYLCLRGGQGNSRMFTELCSFINGNYRPKVNETSFMHFDFCMGT